MSTEARQLGLKMLNASKAADTESKHLLEQARAASMKFAMTQSSADCARRAVLAQQAYTKRVNAVVGREMAAYALLAADAGAKVTSAKNIAEAASRAQRNPVLVREGTGSAGQHQQRHDLMLQAAKASASVLKSVPPLDAVLIGRRAASAQQQVSVTGSQTWRNAEYVERANAFFPADVRRAAGSFAGVEALPHDAWFNGLQCACNEATKVRGLIRDIPEVKQALSQPATLGAIQEADVLTATMEADTRVNGASVPSSSVFAAAKAHVVKYPKAHLAAALGLGYLFYWSRK